MLDRETIIKELVLWVQTALPETRGIEIVAERDLRDFASLDSLAVLELLSWVEARYQVVILDTDEKLHHLYSVGALADYVIRHGAERH